MPELFTTDTIGIFLEKMTGKYPNHEFIVFPELEIRWSFSVFNERVDRLARGLLHIGIAPGDHVGIWANNVPDWLTFFFASAKIGAVLVPINTSFKRRDAEYVIADSDVKALALVDHFRDSNYREILRELIPEMTTAGLLGFSYTCPDMIGGGSFTSFLNIKEGTLDEELIVRSCQIHAMMPMMQFSVAPWRVLSPENRDLCARFARLHEQMGPYIVEWARKSSITCEPIVQSMEYAFPHQGFIDCDDQFMLGDRYLVAPMVTRGYERAVKLPKGRWRDERGKIFNGGKTIIMDVPIERLPYFERLK